MFITGTAISTALNALRLYSRRVDQAAAQIARSGLGDVSAEPTTPSAASVATAESGGGDLGEAMVTMMIAQRAFSAQLKVLKTADEMLLESVQVTDRR